MKRYTTIAFSVMVILCTASCNDTGNQGSNTEKKDTNLVDTRRNSGDTGAYMVHDSTNQMNREPNSQ